MSFLTAVASETNPLVPTAWEGVGIGSAVAYAVLAVWATIAILGARQSLSPTNTLALILAAWCVPLLGAVLVLVTAYQQPKKTAEDSVRAEERPLSTST